MHSSVAARDGTVRGGHLLHAVVGPTLEMFITVNPQPIEKRHDAKSGLDLLDLGT